MIIDSPILTAIAVGAGRVIPEVGDAQVQVPSTVIPILQVMQPTNYFLSSNGNDAGSNITTLTLARNNQAAIASQLQLLPKGLYDIEVMLSSSFNFTPAGVPSLGASIRFGLGASANRGTLLAHYAAIGVQSSSMRYRMLLLETIVFDLLVMITGAAENIGATATVNAVRIL